MRRLTRDGTAEPVSRGDQILRRERGQGINHFPCSADHEQDWQPTRLILTLAIYGDPTVYSIGYSTVRLGRGYSKLFVSIACSKNVPKKR